MGRVSHLATSLAIGALPKRLADGGCWSERLLGTALPSTSLESTVGRRLELAELSCEPLLVFVHPGVECNPSSPRDPDGLLSSGCTLQARGFKDLALDYAARGTRVVGVSSLAVGEQKRFAQREQLSFPLLSDPTLELVGALGLPTYLTGDGRRLYERLSFLAHEGTIQRVFHPVPIPRRNATDILTSMNHHATLV